jgi:outer membrane protein assembly factor BamB
LWVKLDVPRSAIPGPHPVEATGQESGLSALAAFTVRTDWAQLGFDAAHSGANRFENVLGPDTVAGLTMRWSVTPGSSRPPVVAAGRVYVAREDLSAYDAGTGALLWTVDADDVSVPAMADGRVVVIADGRLLALDATNGVEQWSSHDADYEGELVLDHRTVYAGVRGGDLRAVDAIDGTSRWRVHVGTDLARSVAVSDGVVYVAADPNRLEALEAATGGELWRNDVAGNPYDSPVVADGLVYVGTEASVIASFATDDGRGVWYTDIGGGVVKGPAVADLLVFAEGANVVTALGAGTGVAQWSHSSTGGYAPVVANGVLYQASTDGTVYAFDAATGAVLWTFATDQPQTGGGAAVADGVLFASMADAVYAFDLGPGAA